MNPVPGQPPMYNPYSQMPPLPAGWVEHRTPTGQPYWYCTMTGQSSWVYPIVAPMAAAPAVPAPPAKKKKQIKKKIPGTNWLFVLTHDGYEFYYDRETKKSVWEMPEELKEPMEELKKLEEEEKEAKKKEEEEAKKKQEEEEAQRKKEEEEESKKRALLEEEEQQLEAKRVKLEGEITEATTDDINKEQELETTEMTEEDIMWQLQQMEEGSDAGEYDENDMEYQLQQQQDEEEEVKEKAPKAVEEKKPGLSEEECIAKFNELLEERNISPFAMYATEYPQLMSDPRFSLVPANKQKSLFNKYCHDLGEKIKNEKKNKKKPEDEYRELLESKVKVKMYWDDFRRKYKDDARFKAISTTKEREALFKEHIKYNLNKKKDPVQDYIDLLRNTKEIKQGIRWRDAKKILERDDRYFAIDDKDKREDLFRDYLDGIF